MLSKNSLGMGVALDPETWCAKYCGPRYTHSRLAENGRSNSAGGKAGGDLTEEQTFGLGLA